MILKADICIYGVNDIEGNRKCDRTYGLDGGSLEMK